MVPTGDHPVALAIADLNQDNVADAVTANSGSGDISVLLGAPGGGFAPQVRYAAGTSPASLTILDFNLDGRLDVAVADSGTNTVRMLLATAPGTFANSIQFPAAGVCVWIITNDFNGDGKPDIATANSSSKSLTILTGTGAGAVATAKKITIGLNVNTLESDDFDGDGDVDLAYTSPDSSALWTLRQNSNFTFAGWQQIFVGSGPNALLLRDMNQDGLRDLVTTPQFAGATHGATVIFRGTSGFLSPLLVNTGGASRCVAAEDLTNDGILDLITFPGDKFAITPGANGSFGPAISYDSGVLAVAAAARDFTNDGIPDVLGLSYLNGGLFIFRGLGNQNYDVLPNVNSGTVAPASISHADLNLDGSTDLIAGATGGGLFSIFGNGDGTFGAVNHYNVIEYPAFVDSADFNNDGLPDVVSCNRPFFFSGSQTVQIYLNVGGGMLGLMSTIPNPQNCYSGAIVDLNNNGTPDFVTVNLTSQDMTILLCDGMGGLSITGHFPLGGTYESLAVLDYNSDGNPDLATAGFTSAANYNIQVVQGDGQGGLLSGPTLPVGLFASHMTSSDLNRDGATDLAASGQAGTIIIHGDGAGAFPVINTIYNSHTADPFQVADLNGDGFPEIVEPGSDSATVLFMNGGATPSEIQTFPVGYSSHVMVAADMDRDGRPDITSLGYNDGRLVFLKNMLAPAAGSAQVAGGTAGCFGDIITIFSGSPNIGNLQFSAVATQAPPLSHGALLVSDAATAFPLDFFSLGFFLSIDIPQSTELFLVDIATDVAGVGHAPLPVPSIPQLAGNVYFAQSIFIEPRTLQCSGAIAGFVSGSCASITILP